jgi:hypothetical protein
MVVSTLHLCAARPPGDRITGPGTAGLVYVYSNGTCVADVGSGTLTWSIPTEGAVKHLTGHARAGMRCARSGR